MPRRRRSVSSSPPPRRLAPALRHRPQRLTRGQFLHRLFEQRQHIARLIVVFGPFHRIEFFLSSRPDVLIVATLVDCLGLQDIFWRAHDARFFVDDPPVLEDLLVDFDDLPALEDLDDVQR